MYAISKFESKKNESGFTLVEMVIVIALLSLLLLAFLNLFDNHGKLFNFESGRIRTTSGTRFAMSELQKYTLQAESVLVSATVNGTSYSSSSSVMVLRLPSVDASNNAIDSTWDYVAFYLTGTNLYRTVEANGSSVRASGTKLLSDTVSSLSFTYNSADFTQVNQIDVDLTSQLQIKNSAVSSREQQKLYLRNY
jgi:prepilin-type N-terminal cleavage/methylation domain-containing protein